MPEFFLLLFTLDAHQSTAHLIQSTVTAVGAGRTSTCMRQSSRNPMRLLLAGHAFMCSQAPSLLHNLARTQFQPPLAAAIMLHQLYVAQHILSMIYVLGACLRAVTFWPCQSACFLTVYSMVTDTKHRAIVSDGSLQPIMPGWSLIPANSQSHSEAAACLLHILRVYKEKTPGACSADT